MIINMDCRAGMGCMPSNSVDSIVTYGSVCSGIESASVAWEPLGMKAAWLSEIEPFPCAVLAHHWPRVPNLGDMTTIADYIRCGMVSAPPILVGGTPCQAFSVAGSRASLDDARGQLTLEYVRLLNAIDEQRKGDECVAVWENVPGVLNTKDNAFGCFLGALSGEDDALQPPGKKWSNSGCVFGPLRTVAWRILDAQYFGVAQRRRRVFVVASARNGFDPCQVLFEFEGVRRDIAPSRKTGKEITGGIRAGSHWDDGRNPHPTINQSHNTGVIGSSNQEIFSQRGGGIVAHRMVAFGEYPTDETASTMKARDYKDATDLVTYGIPGNWIGRKPENGGNATEPMNNIAPCQTVTDRHAVQYGGSVRRLTPTECERLQGFPDGHTQIPWKGADKHECPDGHRYKALGNSKAVPVVRWVGERILDQLRSLGDTRPN